MLSSGAILTRLANKVFSFLGTNFAQQSKYHPAAYKWDSENLVVCAVVYM
jgi:hypothetical protein